jgi:hypothetical protein
MQDVPVGSGDISGMCLTTAIIVRAYQSSSKLGCSRMHTFLAPVDSQAAILIDVALRFSCSAGLARADFRTRTP